MPAGVMLLLYRKDGELRVLLNRRTDQVEHHKGQISFPGGAKDPEDVTILATALRETSEEMGVTEDHVEVICRLDQVSTRTGFTITPFVGAIPPTYPFRSSDIEVAEVLEVPLSTLLDSDNWITEERQGPEGTQVSYSYRFNEHVIWGATARILSQFLGLIASEKE